MEELLQRLEYKIKEIVDQRDNLRFANNDLHQGQSDLVNHNEILQTKHKQAISQIETLVSRLKVIEKLS